MSSILSEEAHRLGRVFIFYTEVIVGGMLASALFFLVYAGVRSNNIPLEIVATVLTTLVLSGAIIIGYFSIRGLRKKNEVDNLVLTLRFIELESELARALHSAPNSENDVDIKENEMEEARRRIQDAMMSLSSSQLETLRKPRSLYQSFIYSLFRIAELIMVRVMVGSIYLEFRSPLSRRQEDEARKDIVRLIE